MQDKVTGEIISINGPIIKAQGMDEAGMLDFVLVGKHEMIGEIIKLKEGTATIQVYEDNSMMQIGEKVVSNKRPLSVLLGPGILQGIYDGLQRPLEQLYEKSGIFLLPGVKASALPLEKRWEFIPTVEVGSSVVGGTKIGYVDETDVIRHWVMIPPLVGDDVIKSIVSKGEYTVEEPIVKLESGIEVRLSHYWPVRQSRPYKHKLPTNTPLITGQRVIDMFFPLAKGGTAAIPGGFGTGKTMTQHALAKWSDAEIIVYIGCGERGNEMTDVLNEFPHLVDPKTNKPLMMRTVLIANTSNMPVAAREVSIYTGVTIAEYFRDMGYNVSIMADSTSRWAEALRELSGRLEEMPAEEGFPAYLPTRLAEFYERAGVVKTVNDDIGSISIIGAVSPPGGDFSEPVTQHTKRFIRCFWALDKSLANARHYPAISWLDSYSEYTDETTDYWFKVDSDTISIRTKAYSILKDEEKLAQIVKLVGPDSLPDTQRLILLVADIIKKGFLQQNAFDDIDMYSTPKKQIEILKLMIRFYDLATLAIKKGAPIVKINELKLSDRLIRLKTSIPNDKPEMFNDIMYEIESAFSKLDNIYSGK